MTVTGGGRLRSVIDDGDGSCAATGPSASWREATWCVLGNRVFSIPRYSRIQLDMASARLTVAPDAEMRVDGKLFLMGEADAKTSSVRQCGNQKGPGSIVGNAVDTLELRVLIMVVVVVVV